MNSVGESYINSINTYNKNKFKVRFSNFPNFTGKEVNMNVFNTYIQTFTIPDINIPMLSTLYLQERQLHPNPIGQRELQTITITFQIDEELINWYSFYCWLISMRHGETCGKTNLKGEELLRLDCIDKIEVIHCNNNDEITSKMVFGHCILNNLSSLELNLQTSEIATFTVTFEVETVDLDLLTTEE